MILMGSSDPGAIKYFVSFYKDLDSKVYFTSIGKSKKILNKNNLIVKRNWRGLKNIKLVITGASTGTTLDKELILWSKKNKIFCISIIEHWTNLIDRFKYKNRYLFPDKIFVNDMLAKKMAIKSGIKKELIMPVGNPVLEELSINYKKNKYKLRKTIYKKTNYLFLSEPIYESSSKKINKSDSLEFRTIEHLIDNIDKDREITIKLHPREKTSKYNYYNNKNKNIKIKRNITLVNMASSYKYIIGIKTFLLFELHFFRDDLFSLNLDNDNFAGEILGVTKNITNINNLENKQKLKKKTYFKNKYLGSKAKIISQINQIKKTMCK